MLWFTWSNADSFLSDKPVAASAAANDALSKRSTANATCFYAFCIEMHKNAWRANGGTEMQTVWAGFGHNSRMLSLPHAEVQVMPGVAWGCASEPFSPAYWVARCAWPDDTLPRFETRDGLLIEEVGFCLLGGFGIKYEMNRLAFDRLRDEGVFDASVPCDHRRILDLLLTPFDLDGRKIRYRFPNQRAWRIAAMRQTMDAGALLKLTPLAMRDALQVVNGIGPKTASWIVRNLLGSDDVAILDVHVIRACRHIGLFPAEITLPGDYRKLEELFLTFAKAVNLQPSVLDAVMWAEVRVSPGFVPLVDRLPRSVKRNSEAGGKHGRPTEH